MTDVAHRVSHRIAIVVGDAGVPVLGHKGAAVHVRAMANAFMGEGHQPVIFAARIGSGNEIDCPVHMPLPNDEERAIFAFGGDAPVNPEIQRLMLSRAFEDQILVEHRSQPFSAVYERLSIWSYAGVSVSRRLGLPHIVEANARLVTEQERYRALELGDLALSVERLLLTKADAILAVSQPLADELRAAGASPERLHVVPNGVDPERFSPAVDGTPFRQKWGIDPAEIVLGFVGTIRPWHGVSQVIRAAALLPRGSVRLAIVGDGPQLMMLREMAGDLELPVVFTGAIPHDEVPDAVASFDIAAAPYAENAGAYFSPLKAFEYAASGKAVVAASGGQVEALFPPDTVVLYPPEDIESLAARISELAKNRAERERLGAAALEFVTSHHTWRHNARHVIDLVETFSRKEQLV